MVKNNPVIIALFLVAASAGLARGALRLEIEGNRAFGTKRLYREMSVKGKQIASADSLGPALHRLASFYRRQGYIQARVEYLEEANHDSGRTRIFIDEGPRFLVRDLKFLGNDSLPAKVLRRYLKLGPGRPYNPEGLGQEEFNLMMAYADYGYIFASIENAVEILADNTAAITFVISEGQRVRIGDIRVLGRSFADSSYLIRTSGLSSGDYYSRRRLNDGEMKLISSGLFKEARIITGTVSPDSQLLNLDIAVAEKPRRRIEAGLGYGSGDAFRLTARWQNRNLWGWAQRLEFSGIAAAQLWRRPRLVRGRTQLAYYEPWLFKRDLPAQLTAYYDDYRPPYSDYRLQTIGFDLDIFQRIGQGFYIDWRASQQWLRLSPNWRDPQSPLDTIRYHGRRSIFCGLNLRRLDDPLAPRRGFTLQIDGEYTGGLFGGVNTYQRASAAIVGYRSMKKPKMTLACRLKGGLIGDWNKKHTMPYYEKFFLGGPTTLRGYASGRGGVIMENGQPQGGRKVLLANIELRPTIYKRWLAGIFLDAGILSDNVLRKISLREALTSPGIGLRYALPLGTGRLDFSAPGTRMGYIKEWKVIVAWGEVF